MNRRNFIRTILAGIVAAAVPAHVISGPRYARVSTRYDGKIPPGYKDRLFYQLLGGPDHGTEYVTHVGRERLDGSKVDGLIIHNKVPKPVARAMLDFHLRRGGAA